MTKRGCLLFLVATAGAVCEHGEECPAKDNVLLQARGNLKTVDVERAGDAAYCAAQCEAAGYCCNDWQRGSNQMISCAQACMMRAGGSATSDMLTATGGICNRNGQSGCSLTVNGQSYGFCSSCSDLTSDSKCSWGVASSEACDFGAGLSPPGAGVCTNTCDWKEDNDCDDGGDDSDYSLCDLGTDCIDCGERTGNSETCTNTCNWASDTDCDDGGADSDYSLCDLGTDCIDCGERSGAMLLQQKDSGKVKNEAVAKAKQAAAEAKEQAKENAIAEKKAKKAAAEAGSGPEGSRRRSSRSRSRRFRSKAGSGPEGSRRRSSRSRSRRFR